MLRPVYYLGAFAIMAAWAAGGIVSKPPQLVPAAKCTATTTCIPDLGAFMGRYDGLISVNPSVYGERDGVVTPQERVDVYLDGKHSFYSVCMSPDSEFFPTPECEDIRQERANRVLTDFIPYDVTGDREISFSDDLFPDGIISIEDALEARL
ncbi:hypothetical protein HOD38_02905 [archaeon]|jgi:hypothetical protein|nr:hypothetical protein [archaeon]MBT4397191.1 hypothetical protein [archaeon]MBT4440571.1 hypothetical protein [archaeon]